MFSSGNIINQQIISPHLRAFFVGFDLNQYRLDPFADAILDTVVDFAFGYHTGILKNYDRKQLIEAAKSIYRIDEYSQVKWVYVDEDSELSDCEIKAEQKYLKRGEFGEMILHLLLRDFFNTIPLLAKIHFKDTDNVTVHGFDIVHIGSDIKDSSQESLYLGESKLYSRKDGEAGKHGVNELIEDVKGHFKTDFLARELALISKKKNAFKTIEDYVDQNTLEDYKTFLERKKKWFEILHQVQSGKLKLQDFLKSVSIPLVCTYQSNIFDSINDENSNQFKAELEKEIKELSEHFSSKLSQIVDITHYSLPLISQHSLPLISVESLPVVPGFRRLFQSKVYHFRLVFV